MLEDPKQITAAKIRIAAMDILTGREYSRAELAAKLNRRFDQHPDIDQVLKQLAEDGLQSDARFTEAFIRSRILRGHGMTRIQQDIRQKGIADNLFQAGVEEADVDWFELALDVARRKFGHRPAEDQRERARRLRFMQYRGFNFDQVKYALGTLDKGEDWDI